MPGQILSLPSWIPGSYLLREFARHVVAISASGPEGPIRLEQIAKGSWRADPCNGPLTVTMTVHALDLSVRGAYFDRHRAFFNGTSLFLEPRGRAGEAIELVIASPPHAGDWRVATAMRPAVVDDLGFGRYRADDYDELIDHPFEIGRHDVVEFEACGVPHRFVVAGRFDADLDRVATDLTQLCTAQIEFFGRPAPFADYTFLGLAVGDGYGGLEHRASSSLIFRRTDLPKHGEPGLPDAYQRFLGLVSHEYFHSWHIKRTKPAAFMPYRLDRRNPTRLLWVFEGITSYFQERFLLYAGLLGPDAHLKRIAEALTRVYRVPGRFRQSLAQSSYNAWDRLYKPHPNSVNQDVSYYSKGALVALSLDLRLRQEHVTLDEIVVELWRRFGSRNIGLPEDGFGTLVAEFGGEPVREFLEAAVSGTSDPDLAALFRDIGLRLVFRQSQGPGDNGGKPAASDKPKLTLGAGFEEHAAGLRLTVVFEGQPAERAGLAPGDIIVAVNRIRVSAQGIAEQLDRFEEGEEIDVSFFRADELAETRLVLALAPADTCYLEFDETAEAQVAARRALWLAETS